MTGGEPADGSCGATPQPTRLQRLAGWYGNVSDILSPQRLLLLAGLGLIVVVGMVGGWGTVSEAADELSVADVGKPVAVAPFEVTVNRARWFDKLEPTLYAEDGYRYLAVLIDVTNTTNEPVSGGILAETAELDAAALKTIELKAGPTPIAARALRGADGLTQYTLQPGLTQSVVLVWQQEAGEPLPTKVTFTLSGHTERRSAMDGSLGWRDPEPVAKITLPLEPLPEQ